MKLRFAVMQRVRLEPPRMDDFILLLEEDIKKLDLTEYEDDDDYERQVYRNILDKPCIEVYDSFHKWKVDEEGEYCDRIGGFVVDSELANGDCGKDCNIVHIINMLSEFEFRNMDKVTERLMDKYFLKEEES